MKTLMSATGVLLVASVLAGAYVQSTPTFAPGTVARVVHSSAVLRARASSLSPAVKTVNGGDSVEILEAASPWYKARAQGAEGYIHGSALLDQKEYALAVGQGASGVTYAERTAAARGFNPKVEEQHRVDRPDLQAGYAKVDAIEQHEVSTDALIAFRAQGGIK